MGTASGAFADRLSGARLTPPDGNRALMSSTRHPIANRLDSWVDGPTKLLATVMGLPLVDGIFAAIVLAGGLASTAGVVQVGLLVFGGSATVAVVIGEFGTDRRESLIRVLLVGIPLIVLAGLEAAIAPTIGSALSLPIFERFAALVVLAIAAKTVSARVGEYLPKPSAIVALGLIASLRPGSARLVLDLDPVLVARAVAAAGVGVAFACLVVSLRPHLAAYFDIERFRFGSAIALGMLAVSLFQPAYTFAPLAVLVVSAVLAFEPSGEADDPAQPVSTDGGHQETDEGTDADVSRAPYL